METEKKLKMAKLIALTEKLLEIPKDTYVDRKIYLALSDDSGHVIIDNYELNGKHYEDLARGILHILRVDLIETMKELEDENKVIMDGFDTCCKT
jgi:hypothetical protein